MRPIIILKAKDVKDYISNKNENWSELITYMKDWPNTAVFINYPKGHKRGELWDGWSGNIRDEEVEEYCRGENCEFRLYNPKNDRILKRCK